MFICPACKARFRVVKLPKSGTVKCPKCGVTSRIKSGAPAAAPAQRRARPESPPPPSLSPNTVVAGHRITEYVGGSETTELYKASQSSMSRSVLLNVLRPKYAADESAKSRFFAEARGAARLNHPNLLSVFDMAEEGGVCFFTTEFADGGTLPQFLKRQEKISSKRRLSIMTEIVRALAYAESEGIQKVWLGPEDVLLTGKGEVRVGRVGAEAPLEGGSPHTIMSAMAQLMYMILTGKGLPPGAPDSVSIPAAPDALGTKLNNAVSKLLKEGHSAYGNVGEFAAEMEKLSEGAQRRSTVNTSGPGGVAPRRLHKARRSELPTKTILIAILGVAGLAAAVIFFALTSARSKKDEASAIELWNQGCAQQQKAETRINALDTFKKLVTEYGDTTRGEYAKSKRVVAETKNLILNDLYSAAGEKYRDKPRQSAQAIAAIKAAREKLERIIPDFPLVEQQEKVRIKNIHTRYTRAAIHDWNTSVLTSISGYCRRMQFGNALTMARKYEEEWSESEKAKEAANIGVTEINRLAREKLKKIMSEVDQLMEENKRAQAEGLLDEIIRNFGIPELVDQAKQKLKTLQS